MVKFWYLPAEAKVSTTITCDCQLNKSSLTEGAGTNNQTHKHEHQLKGDWNFLNASTPLFQHKAIKDTNVKQGKYLPIRFSSNWIKEIFHPPAC